MPATPIFIGGTGSHVGKSWVATALCRYLYRMGYRVAPFKAQNMSNNSGVCEGGGEIGRAQVAQAEACRLKPHPDMNPILLKPTGALGSHVIVDGVFWRNLRAQEYYTHFEYLCEKVLASYARLAANYEFVVIEGAGSITELNLKHRDLVNLGLASRLDAACILVADIDRGGVFASTVGTFQLLEPDERRLVRTFLINRFRGDPALFKDGIRILEEKTGRPCLGLLPFAGHIHLDAEDSLSLDDHRPDASSNPAAQPGSGRVAIIRLPHISNFTDFRLLPEAVYVSSPSAERFDFIFLPGTKSTIPDLLWLRRTGLDSWLIEQLRLGARLIGICGGYQMLGEEIVDPFALESTVSAVRGLGLIAARTHLAREKITRAVRATTANGSAFEAYEIHMGITAVAGDHEPFARLDDGTSDGIRSGSIIGTYLHGAFEDRQVLEELLGRAVPDSAAAKDAEYDRMADWFAEHVDLELLFRTYIRTSGTGADSLSRCDASTAHP